MTTADHLRAKLSKVFCGLRHCVFEKFHLDPTGRVAADCDVEEHDGVAPFERFCECRVHAVPSCVLQTNYKIATTNFPEKDECCRTNALLFRLGRDKHALSHNFQVRENKRKTCFTLFVPSSCLRV